jgi:hypothetical protein
MVLDFLLISLGYNFSLLLGDEQNSKYVLGVLAVIKCIYLPPTYLYFIQDIEDRCLLLTSSTSFVDLPFQECWMMEKHHVDQNPYISSICPKPGVITDNTTRGDDVAQSPGPTEPKWGRLVPHPWPAGQGLAYFQNLLSPHVKLSQQEGNPKWERRCCYKTWPPSHPSQPAGLTCGPPEPQLRPWHRLNSSIKTPVHLLAKKVNKVRFNSI